MEAINPDLRDLQQKYKNLRAELARTQGEVELLKRTTSDNTRQTIWQFVIFTITMAVILVGGIRYQADTLRLEFDLRFESLDKRIDQAEKNISARFEDLKQEVRASHQK
ncbi:MAG: hypothetical protein U0Z53_04020 [Blastocatellia bacterium]